MRAHYVVYPFNGYLVESYRGPVTYAGLLELMARQASDARILAHYHTLADFTQATIKLSNDEVYLLANLFCRAPHQRAGKRAFVIDNARNLGFANVLEKCLAESTVVMRTFRERSAAREWLAPTQELPTVNVYSIYSPIAPCYSATP